MCRLLATIGNVNQAQMQAALKQFGNLADCGCVPGGMPSGHRDGWGLLGFDAKGKNLLIKSTQDASLDKKYPPAAKKIINYHPKVLIGHLRKASQGAVTLQNTHPFVKGIWSFAHNGAVMNSNKIPLIPKFKKMVKGETDSEVLFAYFLQILSRAKKANPKQALAKVLDYIKKYHDYTAINLLISDGRRLLAVREINLKNSFVKSKKLINYYTLFLGKNVAGGKIICSEKLNLPGMTWRAIKNHEILELAI